jgi:hypothetical protein
MGISPYRTLTHVLLSFISLVPPSLCRYHMIAPSQSSSDPAYYYGDVINYEEDTLYKGATLQGEAFMSPTGSQIGTPGAECLTEIGLLIRFDRFHHIYFRDYSHLHRVPDKKYNKRICDLNAAGWSYVRGYNNPATYCAPAADNSRVQLVMLQKGENWVYSIDPQPFIDRGFKPIDNLGWVLPPNSPAAKPIDQKWYHFSGESHLYRGESDNAGGPYLECPNRPEWTRGADGKLRNWDGSEYHPPSS